MIIKSLSLDCQLKKAERKEYELRKKFKFAFTSDYQAGWVRAYQNEQNFTNDF